MVDLDEPTMPDAGWRADETVEIEADTVADAMARVAAEIGEDAQIVDARKSVRGGIGGFFAKERVVLTVRTPAPDLSSILDRMSREIDAEETEFGAVLRRQLAGRDAPSPARAAAPPAPNPPPAHLAPTAPTGTIVASEDDGYTLVAMEEAASQPVSEAIPSPVFDTSPPFPNAPEGRSPVVQPSDAPPWRVMEMADGVAWGVTELVRRGLPERIVAAVADLDPRDDLGWINGIAAAVAPLCGGPLDLDGVVVGAEAGRVAALIDAPMVEPEGMAPYAGGFWSPLAGTYEEQKWLDYVLAGRPLHVVIDDTGAWGDLLVADPSVVSWVGEGGVASALHLAATLGARLGFAPLDGDADRLVRVSPIDVALSVRRLMRRR